MASAKLKSEKLKSNGNAVAKKSMKNGEMAI
jgi:hypothetical protein